MRRIFIDAEFTNLPWCGHSHLLWLGLADEDGRSWSAINADATLDNASQFTLDVVVPKMPADEPRLSRDHLAAAVVEFCGDPDEFWAWCPTVDNLALLGLHGSDATEAHTLYWDWDLQLVRGLIDPWPEGWPTECQDVHQLAITAGIELPVNPNAHHPASDALWDSDVFRLSYVNL